MFRILHFSRRLRSFWWKPSVRDEIDAELAFHLAMRARELEQRGWPPDAARAEAARRLGALDRVAARCRTEGERRDESRRRRSMLDELRQDLRYGLRSVRRSPGFAAAVILTLGLGIGVTTAMFSVVHGVLLRPLPFPDAERVVVIHQRDSLGRDHNQSAANFIDLTRDLRSVSGLAGYRFDDFALSVAGAEPVHMDGVQVTPEFFEVFAVPALVGRTFDGATARASGGRLAVLSEGSWRQQFGADPRIIGQTVSLSGEPYRITAVMPASFTWPERAMIWVATTGPVPTPPFGDGKDIVTNRGLGYFDAVGRVKPNVTMTEVTTELAAEAHRLQGIDPANNAGLTYHVVSAQQELVGDVRTGLLMLLGAVGFVMLIATVNVASLSLARGSSRQREFVVRAAIGAGRGRLIRQLVVESQIYAWLGGAVGVLLAVGAARLVARLAPLGLPRAAEVSVDGRVLGFALILAVVVGLLFGLTPALAAGRTRLAEMLRSSSRSSTAHGGTRLRSVLVVAEIALAVVVLVGAGLLASSLIRLERTDPGFRSEQITTISLSLNGARYAGSAAQIRFYDQVRAELVARHPRWTVSLAFPMPLGNGSGSRTTVSLRPGSDRSREEISVLFGMVSGDYFRTLGIPVVAGREFGEQDQPNSAPVVILNLALAERLWPGQNPVGRQFSPDLGSAEIATVVGVVANTRSRRLDEPAEPMVYSPYRQLLLPYLSLLVRSTEPEGSVVKAVREVVTTIDPDLPLGKIRPLTDVVAGTIAAPRLRVVLLGSFAALALVLGAIGIYGLLTFLVTVRRREVGIRLALGATPARVVRRTVGEGLRLTVMGLILGLAVSFGVSRFLSGFLYQVRPADPLTLSLAVLVLGLVAVGASYLPARRAAAVDPAIALRDDG